MEQETSTAEKENKALAETIFQETLKKDIIRSRLKSDETLKKEFLSWAWKEADKRGVTSRRYRKTTYAFRIEKITLASGKTKFQPQISINSSPSWNEIGCEYGNLSDAEKFTEEIKAKIPVQNANETCSTLDKEDDVLKIEYIAIL